jgi:hypothetical protein
MKPGHDITESHLFYSTYDTIRVLVVNFIADSGDRVLDLPDEEYWGGSLAITAR